MNRDFIYTLIYKMLSFVKRIHNHVSDGDYNKIKKKLKKGEEPPYPFEQVILRNDKLYFKDPDIAPTSYPELIPQSKVNETLKRLYHNPALGMGGRDWIYNRLKKMYIGISLRATNAFLKTQEAAQLMMRIPKQTTIKRVHTREREVYFECDLVDMSQYSHFNNGTHFLLNIIDVSPYRTFMSIPLKNKEQKTVRDGFKKFFNIFEAKIMQSDRGSEFTNKLVEDLFKKHGVKHVLSSPYLPQSSGLIERANQTLKKIIKRYMIMYGTKRYIDVLDSIVKNINEMNEITAEKRIKRERERVKPKVDNDLHKGDRVRVLMRILKQYRKNTLSKAPFYWTKEIYTVRKVIRAKTAFDLNRYELSDGRQYTRSQLQKIGKVVRTKVNKKKEAEEEKVMRKQKVDKVIKHKEGISQSNIVREKRVRKSVDRGFLLSDTDKFF